MMLFQAAATAEATAGPFQRFIAVMQAPIPDVSLWMVTGGMVGLFLLLRQRNAGRVDLGVRAETVLRERYARGEITEETYRKMMADVRLRPRY